MKISDILNQLRSHLLQMRSQLDQADAHVSDINLVVKSIGDLKLVTERTLLGHVVHMREYSPRAHQADSGLVLQAALDIPQGLGIAAWDSEEYAELRTSPEGLGPHASLKFVPFNELEPAVRALLLPHVESLLIRLIQLADPFDGSA